MRSRYLIFVFLLGLLALVSGCGPAGTPTPPPVVDVTPATATSPAVAPPTATPSPPTATPRPTPTPDPCPARQELAPPSPALAINDYVAAVESYLSQGGDPAQVALAEGDRFVRADLTGDATPEFVYTFTDPAAETIFPLRVLVAYTCRDGAVTTLYSYRPGEMFSLELIGSADLTGDGIADMVFSEYTCGAHTCWHTPRIWTWEHQDVIAPPEGVLSFPYPTFMLQEDALLVGSAGIGSVGAGPQRPYTTTLVWSGTQLTETTSVQAPAVYRYHVFAEGDEALLAGDPQTARRAYRRVLAEEGLRSWAAATGMPDVERPWLEALARWRLLTLDVAQGDITQATQTYERLVASVQSEDAPYPVVEFAGHFWQQYREGGSMPQACQAALALPQAQAILDFLNSFGYANPYYELPDLCPF